VVRVLDNALERHPAMLHTRPHLARRDVRVPVQDVGDRFRDVTIVVSIGETYLQLVGNSLHTVDTLGGLGGSQLLWVGKNMTGQCDRAIFHGHADRVCVWNLGVPPSSLVTSCRISLSVFILEWTLRSAVGNSIGCLQGVGLLDASFVPRMSHRVSPRPGLEKWAAGDSRCGAHHRPRGRSSSLS